eukprot:scaffold1205_cov249-Pinguiococcus_pyrenoidosus.AAC.4
MAQDVRTISFATTGPSPSAALTGDSPDASPAHRRDGRQHPGPLRARAENNEGRDRPAGHLRPVHCVQVPRDPARLDSGGLQAGHAGCRRASPGRGRRAGQHRLAHQLPQRVHHARPHDQPAPGVLRPRAERRDPRRLSRVDRGLRGDLAAGGGSGRAATLLCGPGLLHARAAARRRGESRGGSRGRAPQRVARVQWR